MKFFICLLLLSFIFSCGESKKDSFRFRDGRSQQKNNKPRQPRSNKNSDKTNDQSGQEAKQSQPYQEAEQSQSYKFAFPISLIKDTLSLHIKSIDNKRIQLSSEEGVISLLAIQSGVLSLNNLEAYYHLVINPNNSKSFNFLLEKSTATLKADDGQQVKKEEVIAETTGSVTFYILENGKELVLCLHDIKSSIPITKELSLTNCN